VRTGVFGHIETKGDKSRHGDLFTPQQT